MLDSTGGLFIHYTNICNKPSPLSLISFSIHPSLPILSLCPSSWLYLSWMTHLPVDWTADTLTVDLTGRLTSGPNDELMSHWPTKCCIATEHRVMSVCPTTPWFLGFRCREKTFVSTVSLDAQFSCLTAQMGSYVALWLWVVSLW